MCRLPRLWKTFEIIFIYIISIQTNLFITNIRKIIIKSFSWGFWVRDDWFDHAWFDWDVVI